MNKIKRLLRTCLGLGYFPLGPGTGGTGLGVIVYWFGLRRFIDPSGLLIYLGILVLLFIVGVLVIGQVNSDSQFIVIDEMVGYLTSMFALPPKPLSVLFAFIIFRILDITKPPPIRYIHNRLKGGFGIMMDDLLSGIITCIILHIGIRAL